MYCLLVTFSLVISDFGMILRSNNYSYKMKKHEQAIKKAEEVDYFYFKRKFNKKNCCKNYLKGYFILVYNGN